jgi:hypothetical protein
VLLEPSMFKLLGKVVTGLIIDMVLIIPSNENHQIVMSICKKLAGCDVTTITGVRIIADTNQ